MPTKVSKFERGRLVCGLQTFLPLSFWEPPPLLEFLVMFNQII